MAEGSRRPAGTGSVSQRKDGRWVGYASFGWVGGGRSRKAVYATSREEVERRLALLLEHGPDGLNACMRGLPRPEADRRAAEIETHTLEQWLAKRDAIGCCIYCGSPGPLEKDHATPVTRGGSNGITNVVPACTSCNASKGNLTAAEFIRRTLASGATIEGPGRQARL